MARCDVTELLTSECAHCQKLDPIPLRDCRVPVRQTAAHVVNFPAIETAAIGTLSCRNTNRTVVHRPGDSFRAQCRAARDANKRFEDEARKGWDRDRIAMWQDRLNAAIEAGATGLEVKVARNYIRQLISQSA